MARYIEAEALKKVMCEGCDNVHLCTESPACETVQQIDAQPTADVDYERGFIEGYTKAESDIFHGGKYAPVKHGHWTPISTAEPPGGIHVLATIQWEDDDLEVTELDYGLLKATRWPHLDKVIAWAPLPEPYKEGQP